MLCRKRFRYGMVLRVLLFYFIRNTVGDEQNEISLYQNYDAQKVEVAELEATDIVIEYMNKAFGHAESPVWDPDTSTLYWVDVLNQNVYAMDYHTLKHKVKHFDCGEVNIVIPISNSSKLLVACRNSVVVMDWEKNTFKRIARLDTGVAANVINEGKCDAYGRFWAGTKGPQQGDKVSLNHATFYKLEGPCYRPKPQLRPVTISNGLVWSLNNSLLYYIDSATNAIDAFKFDLDKGVLGLRRTVLDMNHWGYQNAIPDGMTIDRDGFLWVALYHFGQVIRVNPDTGDIVTVYDLPVPRVTSITWVGDNLEELAVTTSRRNIPEEALEKYPLAGTIFFLKGLGTGGLLDYKFRYKPEDKCLEPRS